MISGTALLILLNQWRNKMRELINADSLSNQISMLRSHPQNRGRAMLLVEGYSDKVFFKNFTEESLLIVAADGKANVIATLAIIVERDPTGILSVVDTDYDYYISDPHLSKIPHHIKKKIDKILFFTDTHDLETLIINSHAMNKLLNQYGDDKKIESIEKHRKIISILVNECKLIGVLKLLSLQKSWHLSFKSIEFQKFFDPTNLVIDPINLLSEVMSKSVMDDLDPQVIIREFMKSTQKEFDSWMVCSGHDLMKILLKSFKYNFGLKYKMNKIENVYQIEDILVLSYEFLFFQKTELYKNMLNWETTNAPFKLFAF